MTEPILLKHHGVKGMKWGVRRKELKGKKYKVYGDGRIVIDKGAKMQRLISTNGEHLSAPLKDYSYMSFLPSDNAEYINTMAPQSKVKDIKRDTILTTIVKNELRSPSVKDMEKINIEIMNKYSKEVVGFLDSKNPNKKFSDLSEGSRSWLNMMELDPLETYSSYHKTTPDMDKEIKKWQDNSSNPDYDPVRRPDRYPSVMYGIANRNIGDSNPDTKLYTKELLSHVEKKGYNMIRDENDVGRWSSPVIVLNPEKNVEVVLSEKISDKKLKDSQRFIEIAKKKWNVLGINENEIGEELRKSAR